MISEDMEQSQKNPALLLFLNLLDEQLLTLILRVSVVMMVLAVQYILCDILIQPQSNHLHAITLMMHRLLLLKDQLNVHQVVKESTSDLILQDLQSLLLSESRWTQLTSQLKVKRKSKFPMECLPKKMRMKRKVMVTMRVML